MGRSANRDKTMTNVLLGHNQPPSAIDLAHVTSQSLRDWLMGHPTINTEDHARDGKVLLDRAKNALGDMNTEREGLVRPLNTQVKTINDRYRAPRETLQTITDTLEGRLTAYTRAERERREQAALAAAQEAEAAAQRVKDAIAAAKEQADNAAHGELTDATESALAVKGAISDAARKARTAARADREASNVKIVGGFKRAFTARPKETLLIVDPQAALAHIGLVNGIRDAMLTAARAYRSHFGELPEGIESRMEEEI